MSLLHFSNQTTAVNCLGWVSMAAFIPGAVQSKYNCCLRWALGKGHIKAAEFFYCINRRMRIVWYLVPHTQHNRRQVLEIHWTHFYWAPTMYTRHWPRCWWYKYSRRENGQKPQPLQSSWSLHSCEIKARKLIHGEKDKLWAKEQFLWGVTKWIPILEVIKKQWSPYGVSQKDTALLSSLTQVWESKGSHSPLYYNLRVEVNAPCSLVGPQGHVRVLSPNQRKAMVLQICFNQDKSLSNMKFNEDEQNCK